VHADRLARRWEALLWALPLVAASVAALPVVVAGFPQGHDWIFELVRSAQYTQAVRAGQWPPTWASELYAGYGSPIFLFYAPLFPAASALGSALLGTVGGGCVAALALLPALAALAIAAMVRQVPGAPAASARAAASFYVLHPYLLGDAWLRNADAEYTALCLAPFALAGLLRARAQPRSAVLWIAAGLALVVLAHNLSGLWLAAVCAGATALSAGRSGGGRAAALARISGIGLGLALASFFWLPALLWLSEVRTEQLLAGKFDFHGNFAALGALFGWDDFFGMGPLTALALAALAGTLALPAPKHSGQRWIALGALLGGLSSVALATPISVQLWELVPLLPLYQFPWRFAGPAALFAALAVALLVSWTSASLGRRAALVLELLLFALCTLQALPRLLQYEPLPAPVRDRLEPALAPAALLRSPLPATVGEEYLPRGASLTAWQVVSPRLGPLVEWGGARVEVLEDRGVFARLRVSSETEVTLRWARWAFPQWRLDVNGSSAALERGPSGEIASRIPAGSYELELRYEPPAARRAGLWLSGIALLSCAAIALAGARPGRSAQPGPGPFARATQR